MGKEGNRNSAKRADSSPGPWTNLKGSRAGKCIQFIETYCRLPKGVGYGKPVHLAQWEKEWIEEIYADNVDAAVMSLPRGQGKSSIVASIATYSGFADNEYGAPVVALIATTVQQSIRSVYSVIESIVSHEPELDKRAIRYSAIGANKIVIPSNEGTIFPLSSDIDGLQGLDITLGICDEIGFISSESWSSLLMAGGKRPRSLVLGLGTPGIDHDNALYQIREKINSGTADLSRFRYKEYSAPMGSDINDENVWRLANPAIDAGYLSIEALRTAKNLSPEAHFRIFRLGQWYEGYDSWLGENGAIVWGELADPYSFEPGKAAFIGSDLAIKRDTASICTVQYRPDGRLHAKVKVWVPTKDEPIDMTDVMAYIRDQCDRYKVGAISYDPRFFDVPAKILYDEGLPMVEVPQSVERMTPIIGNLYELIKTKGLSHDNDPIFNTQVLNAIPRVNDRGFTLSKGKSRGHIDSAISLALAVDRAQHKPKPRPPLVVLGINR